MSKGGPIAICPKFQPTNNLYQVLIPASSSRNDLDIWDPALGKFNTIIFPVDFMNGSRRDFFRYLICKINTFIQRKAKTEIIYDLVPKCVPFSKLFYSAMEIEVSRIYALCHIKSLMIQLNWWHDRFKCGSNNNGLIHGRRQLFLDWKKSFSSFPR